jgi:hypothetical protein
VTQHRGDRTDLEFDQGARLARRGGRLGEGDGFVEQRAAGVEVERGQVLDPGEQAVARGGEFVDTDLRGVAEGGKHFLGRDVHGVLLAVDDTWVPTRRDGPCGIMVHCNKRQCKSFWKRSRIMHLPSFGEPRR